MSGRARGAILLLCSALLAAGCVRTTYRSFDDGKAAEGGAAGRGVTFHLSREYWRAPPDCVAVVAGHAAPAAIRRAVTGAVERHLRARVGRVLGVMATARVARRLAVDLDSPADRRIFARQTRCASLLQVQIEDVDDDYLLVWSRRAVAVGLALTRARDGRQLWRAHHRAGRDDGGLPLSVLSIPYSAARAARLSGDEEIFESIADDAVRRMMATLPDTRSPTMVNGRP